jgi:mono/diheme cytochrome c family protein
MALTQHRLKEAHDVENVSDSSRHSVRCGAGFRAGHQDGTCARRHLLLQHPARSRPPANPVKPTTESLGRGKKQYGYVCAMCHGKTGDGKGDVALDMKLMMHDQTDPTTLKDRTDGELVYLIVHGKDAMPPGEGDRVKAEIIWDMVNYVRSFSTKPAVSEEKVPSTEEKSPN